MITAVEDRWSLIVVKQVSLYSTQCIFPSSVASGTTDAITSLTLFVIKNKTSIIYTPQLCLVKLVQRELKRNTGILLYYYHCYVLQQLLFLFIHWSVPNRQKVLQSTLTYYKNVLWIFNSNPLYGPTIWNTYMCKSQCTVNLRIPEPPFFSYKKLDMQACVIAH